MQTTKTSYHLYNHRWIFTALPILKNENGGWIDSMATSYLAKSEFDLAITSHDTLAAPLRTLLPESTIPSRLNETIRCLRFMVD